MPRGGTIIAAAIASRGDARRMGKAQKQAPKKGGSIMSFFPVDQRRKEQQERDRRQKTRKAKSTEADRDKPPEKSQPPEKARAPDQRLRSKAQRRDAKKGKRKDPPEAQEGADGNLKRAAKPAQQEGNADARKPPAKKPRQLMCDDLDKLREAVEFYDANKEKGGRENSKSAVARRFGFVPRTFAKYVCDKVEDRIPIGAAPGRKSLVAKEECEFLTQHTIRADRANDGNTTTEVIDNLCRIKPDMNREQAKNYVTRTWKKKTEGRIKPRPVKAQKTTSRRSQCTVAQQYRWFRNYDRALRFLREKNTGLCKRTGKTFGELIDYFIVGGDETCMMSDSNGDLKIKGEAGRKKHEKKVSNNRGSITMYRTGTPAGSNGPTAFIMAGKRRRAGYTDAYLQRMGAAPGSTIAMTDKAFMTNDAWDEIAEKVSSCCPYLLWSLATHCFFRPTPNPF